MRFSLFMVFAFFLCHTNAQELILTPLVEGFCKPGVVNKSPGKGISLEYFIQPNINLKSNLSPDESSKVGYNDRLRFKFKIPIIHKEKFSFLLGVDHQREEYEFDFIDNPTRYLFQSIDDKALKTSRLSAYALRPINNSLYLIAKGEATFNGDYDPLIKLDNRYAIYRGAVILGIKKYEHKEYGIGVMYSNGFRKNAVYPVLMYNHTFSPHWGIETVLPVRIQLRYNMTNKNMLLFGTDYKTRVYSLDVANEDQGDTDIFNMRRAEVQLGFTFKQQLHPWIWFDIKTGYLYNFTTRFDLSSPGKERISDFITADPSSGPFLRLGLFLSPPKEYYCK